MMKIGRVLYLLIHVGSSHGFVFQNSVLRYLFQRMTPDSNWPSIPNQFKSIEECRYFDKDIEYPEYYLRDFHAYTGGNLNPIASEEAGSATSAVMKHHFKYLTGEESSHYIRSAFSLMTRSTNVGVLQGSTGQKIVDFGCGIGVSTQYLKDTFKNDEITGIDLSPFFLDKSSVLDAEFIHGNIEDTGIESGSIDVVSISYVLHELPYDISRRVLQEACRILKPDTGVLSILDMHNPKSSSPIMKYIFDRTEPYLKDYSTLLQNMKTLMESVGFENIERYEGFPKTIIFNARKCK